MKTQAARLTRCPRGGCAHKPLPIFCHLDWPKIAGDTRQALLKEWRKLSGKGTQDPPKRFEELLMRALRDIEVSERLIARKLETVTIE